MGFTKPSVKKTKTDIQSLLIYLRSTKKWGKSTLFRDLILEKFGDAEKGLLVGCGAEVGYSILDELNSTQVESWKDMEELKKWLISQKGKEHNIEMIAFDVVSEIIPIAQDEVIAMSKRDTGKPCKNFNSAYGGYSVPREKLKELLKNYFTSLRKAGFGIFAIGHTKMKSIKEKGSDDDGYQILTSDMSNDYEAIFGDIFDCVLTGHIDRTIKDGKVTGEVRKLALRGDSVIDAGCRFRDGAVPEYIVFDKPNMAKEFIEVLEEGLRKSKINPLTPEEFKKQQEAEKAQLKAQHEEYAKQSQERAINEDENVELINTIKAGITKIDATKMKELMLKYEIKDFSDASILPTKGLREIAGLLG